MKAHQKLQNKVSSNSKTEVAVRAEVTVEHVTVTIGGRIDILIPDSQPPEIIEIKSTLVRPERLAEGVREQHWAQLKIYAYCYLADIVKRREETDNPSIVLKVLWHNLQDESSVTDEQEFKYSTVAEFAQKAIEKYVAWLLLIEQWRDDTAETALSLTFPHRKFRKGQRDLAAASYRVFRDGGYLLGEAPTGIGKTVSTLFPAIKAIGEKHIHAVTWLTAKTSGRSIALDTIALMESQGLKMLSLVISSKATTCHCSNGTCKRNDDGRCPLTIGFFDRLPAAREELIKVGRIDSVHLDKIATRHQVCPFELSLQMIPWVSMVVCDYNYVFDPLVVLTHYADPDQKEALLLDETHNLVDRARGMYSARLTKAQNALVKSECRDSHPLILSSLSRVERALNRWAKQQDAQESSAEQPPKTMNSSVSDAVDSIAGAMETGPRELFRYQVIEDLFGDHHRAVTRTTGAGSRKEIELKLMCVNATDRLQKTLAKFRSVVAFSATLRPMQYYCDALGFPEGVKTLELASPFDPDRLKCIVCPYIDTRYHARSHSEPAIVELIARVVKARRGNYLVYLPSYAYLEQVHRAYAMQHSEQRIVVQQRGASLEDRDAFLKNFSDQGPVLGFAIVGGVFGEGIDFPGETLIGCIIVGTGLPGIGIESRLISEDYQQSGLNGFDYACRFPGFTRVLQTAGRVIRKEQDKGVVVLADQRFLEPFYQKLYPSHWNVSVCRVPEDVESELTGFWQDENKVQVNPASDLSH